MVSVNQALHDAAVRHQIFLQRYGGTTANKSIRLLNEAQRDLEDRLRKRLARLGPLDRQQFGRGLVTTKRMQALLDEVKLQNRDLRVALGKQLKKDLRNLAEVEIDIANRRLTEAIGVDLNNLRPAPELLRTLSQMKTVRLRGRTLGQWFHKFEADRFSRVESAVRLGMIEGDTITQIARRIRQAGETSKIAVNALARTSVNHVANTAREAFYEANSDIIKDVRWTATLDGRTSAICRARDGLAWPVDEPHPRPPAHPNCRSVLTPVTKSWEELTDGKFKLDPKRLQGPGFEKAMRKDLASRGMTTSQIDNFLESQKKLLTGKLARTDTYQNWLIDQPKQFQISVLGPTRAKLFREGNLTLDKFVDMRSGKPFNLDQLKKMEEKAWAKVFPEDGGVPSVPAVLFKTINPSSKWEKENYGVWQNNLTLKEKEAIRRYTGPNFKSINNCHREPVGCTTKQFVLENTKELDTALSKVQMPSNTVSFRGMRSNRFKELAQGAEFEDLGYVSTTLSRKGADKFMAGATSLNVTGKEMVLMKIRVPKGFPAGYVNEISASKNEFELILMRGTRFKIRSNKVISGVRHIEVDIVGFNPKVQASILDNLAALR